MATRDPRLRLAPDPNEEPIPVSPRKLADVLRRLEDRDRLERELGEAQGELAKAREEIRRLREEKAHSRAKSAALKAALRRLRNSLSVLGTAAKTAAAVGVPSSRVFFRRSPPPPGQRRPTGGQPGHPGTTRPRPVPNQPPKSLPLKECPKCAHALGDPSDSWSRPVTDLPEAGLDIFDLVIPRYRCPGCGERVHAPIPEAYRGEFGPRLKAFVAELRVLGVPFEKIVELLRMRYGLEVSVASLIAMEATVAEQLDPTYRELGEELRDAERTPHAQGDETGMPVGGRTEWLWVGTSPTLTVYQIQKGRGGEEAAAMWDGYRGKLTHDGLDAYNSVREAGHQMDLVHANRWLQKVEASHGIRPRGFLKEEGPTFERAGRPPKEFLRFAVGVRARLRAEVRWTERYPTASVPTRERRCGRAVRSMGRFLTREWKDKDAARIADELGQRLGTLFTFVRDPGTSWNSNEAEREVRVAVVHRKVSGGRRTERGAWVLERLLTVWRTCAKRERRFWDVVTDRLGALPQAGPGPPSARPVS
ncbi:MAG: IS66 family transposase [Thermoplasmata archaeon]